ncbi:helix-turn-helix domain-containing protein [Chitinophaga rhizosphaerae]|uniref:helix-turn-helix domain-containing protein n=1 Tax=Chitinophaga rhizosphaerae TaxID=1864947 RepID=UPI000F807DB4|nr:helix-turn-helix domain-containing protein [Chitinophaga rhizosphaerae]
MFATFPPPPPLSGYVRMFWVFEHEVPPGEAYVYRSMADGCAELIFHYRNRFTPLSGAGGAGFSHLHAQTSRHSRFLTHGSFGIFGAYLYPTAVPALFGHSSAVIANCMPDLQSIMGRSGIDLEERIITARYHHQRVEILSDYLVSLLGQRKQEASAVQIAVRSILAADGMVNISELASSVSLSTRQFERNFKSAAGFTPKLFTRIIRFHRALDAYGAFDGNLAGLAYECGYYDQSHFIHDFREFSGYLPREYFLGRPEGIEYRE